MKLGFDIISDLNLTGQEDFNWEGKPTSLFCLIPGNISSDLATLYKTLSHLKNHYQGVFFIDGTLENSDIYVKDQKIKELERFINAIPNVVYLHTNVVIVEGIALVGINGWEHTTDNVDIDTLHTKANRYEDTMYLEKTLERLQLHVDVKKIIIISNCVPATDLYFGEIDKNHDTLFPSNTLYTDTEHKVIKWVYGSSDKMVDTMLYGVNFVNNAKHDRNPYYPKRIEVEI